jgi:hypothetical protein
VLEEGQAGANARETHERWRAARLRRLREAGASEAELIAAAEDAPAHEEAWRLGAEGEAAVGRVLDAWAETCGFAVLADLTLPGQRANIDFVVVGPAGVAVIDVKAWTGRLRRSPRGLFVGRYGKRKELAALQDQVARVEAVLHGAGVDLPVAGLLCMANDNDGLPRRKTVRVGEADVGTTDAVARKIGRPGRVDAMHIDAAVAALCEAFVLRGLRPRTVPALLVPDVVSAPPVARPRRRGRRQRRAVSLAAMALGLVAVLHGGDDRRPSSRL